MKTKYIFILTLSLCIIMTACTKNGMYENVDTTGTAQDIGNMCQGGSVTANDKYIFFMEDIAKIFKMSLQDCSAKNASGDTFDNQLEKNGDMKPQGKVTYVCDDPTCTHLADCASGNKTHLQTSGDRIFASGNLETISGSTIVYSSFGEISDGEYNKILEENTLIYMPSITNNRILAEIDNKIKLIDINTKQTIKEYTFDYALSLKQLYCYEDVIYFVNGLGNLYSIDISTDRIMQISKEKVNCAILHGDRIYYMDEKENSLWVMKKDGTNKKLIAEECSAYNISSDKIYYSKNTNSGIFTADLNGNDEKKICDLEGILSIYIFEKQQKLVCSNYECCYIGNLDGSEMVMPKLPERMELY